MFFQQKHLDLLPDCQDSSVSLAGSPAAGPRRVGVGGSRCGEKGLLPQDPEEQAPQKPPERPCRTGSRRSVQVPCGLTGFWVIQGGFSFTQSYWGVTYRSVHLL